MPIYSCNLATIDVPEVVVKHFRGQNTLAHAHGRYVTLAGGEATTEADSSTVDGVHRPSSLKLNFNHCDKEVGDEYIE